MAVANPSSSDAFALLGLPAQFELTSQEIESAFHERTRLVHPDRVNAAEAAVRVQALLDTKAISDAYQVVKRPVKRAEALLAQAGFAITDHEPLDPAFLTDILEAREALAEARVAGNTAAVAAFERDMKDRRVALIADLPTLFAAKAYLDIKVRLITLRYVDRYLEECAAALEGE